MNTTANVLAFSGRRNPTDFAGGKNFSAHYHDGQARAHIAAVRGISGREQALKLLDEERDDILLETGEHPPELQPARSDLAMVFWSLAIAGVGIGALMVAAILAGSRP